MGTSPGNYVIEGMRKKMVVNWRAPVSSCHSWKMEMTLGQHKEKMIKILQMSSVNCLILKRFTLIFDYQAILGHFLHVIAFILTDL